jgi:hypothetical protein
MNLTWRQNRKKLDNLTADIQSLVLGSLQPLFDLKEGVQHEV